MVPYIQAYLETFTSRALGPIVTTPIGTTRLKPRAFVSTSAGMRCRNWISEDSLRRIGRAIRRGIVYLGCVPASEEQTLDIP